MKEIVDWNAERKSYPMTRGEWQLYSSMPGYGLVEDRLTAAIRAVVKKANMEVGREMRIEAAREAYQDWYRFASKFSKFGALDTEPRGVAREVIEWAMGLPKGSIEGWS